MSLVLAILVSGMILSCGVAFNASPDCMVLVLAIVFAGGLAGLKD